MYKNILIYSIIIIIGVLILYSCEHQAPDAQLMDEICFETEILPIFQTSCGSCHNSQSPEGGYVYTDYNSIMQSITPGNPDKSIAYQYITEIIHDFMPPEQPLTIQERSLIRIWIEQGAKETVCPEPNDTTFIDSSVCFSRDILPILLSSCGISGCHDDITQEGDIILTSYNSIMNDGELVVPYEPLNSKMYEVLLKTGTDQMPPIPSDPLPDEQISLIYEWINEGALDEECVILCDTSVFTYSGAIDGIITTSCVSCHSGSSPQGGVSLTNYDEVKLIADDGRLVEVINALNGRPLMPPSGSLSDCQITQIEKWVEDGAPNNK